MIKHHQQEDNIKDQRGKHDKPRHHKWRNMIKHKETGRKTMKSTGGHHQQADDQGGHQRQRS